MIERLIINADDFGLTSGVNRGIIECHAAGIVTSTTLMVRGSASEEAAGLAVANPELGAGLHLNLTTGQPVLPPASVPSLVDSQGFFPGRRRAALWLTGGRARTRELVAEITAQIECCRSLGVEPTHVDSHHHIHAHPRLRALVRRVCREQGVGKLRAYRTLACSHSSGSWLLEALERLSFGAPMVSPDHLLGIEAPAGRSFAARLEPVLDRGAGSLEMMCHPGYYDAALASVSSYDRGREDELRSLLEPELSGLLCREGIRLISYREL